MRKVTYSESDVTSTMELYRNMKKSEISRKIAELKELREECDDYHMAERYTNMIIDLKHELNNL